MAPMMAIGGDMIVDDLPTGSIIFFISTAFVSYFFQFVGFVLTYLLHTTHAAKYGSRAGLGLTMIQYGFSTRMRAAQMVDGEGGIGQDLILWNQTTGMPEVIHKTGPGQAMLPNGTTIDISGAEWNMGSRDWMSLLLILIGAYHVAFIGCLLTCWAVCRLVPFCCLHHRLLSCQAVGEVHPPSSHAVHTPFYGANTARHTDPQQYRACLRHIRCRTDRAANA